MQKLNKDETVKINLTLSIQNKNQMEKICRSLKGDTGHNGGVQDNDMRAVVQRVTRKPCDR